MILSKDDLQQVTGYRRASDQARWLTQHGWRFTRNALGRPVVARAELERQLVGSNRAKTTDEPDWSACSG